MGGDRFIKYRNRDLIRNKTINNRKRSQLKLSTFLRYIVYMARHFRSIAVKKVYRYKRFKFKANNLKRNRNNKNGISVKIKVLRKYTLNIVIRLITFKIRYNNLGAKSPKKY